MYTQWHDGTMSYWTNKQTNEITILRARKINVDIHDTIYYCFLLIRCVRFVLIWIHDIEFESANVHFAIYLHWYGLPSLTSSLHCGECVSAIAMCSKPLSVIQFEIYESKRQWQSEIVLLLLLFVHFFFLFYWNEFFILCSIAFDSNHNRCFY